MATNGDDIIVDNAFGHIIDALAGNDSVFGNGGNDILLGRDGKDLLNGGMGNDSLNGGAGTDTADYSNGLIDPPGPVGLQAFTGATAGVTVDLNKQGSAQPTGGAGTDILVSIENLTGTNFNDTLTGNSGNNVLSGLDGKDTLTGGFGNDRLDGGLGADTMKGGFGNDTYVVDNVGDIIIGEVTDLNDGTDTVLSRITYSLGTDLENLTLTGTAAINGTGNAFVNILTGNSGHNVLSGLAGNDTLTGGLGDDRLDGGLGADTMNGGLGNDTYVIDNVGDIVNDPDPFIFNGGTDTVQSRISYTLGATLENLTLTGVIAINGTGNAKGNIITGNSANNVLSGLGGNDQLSGGLGNDTLNGGLGADTLNGGLANDLLTGGVGRDTLVGGVGNDTFKYNAVNDSLPGALSRDVITDFNGQGALVGDRIDLSGLGLTAGQLRYVGGVLQGNLDADVAPEFEIQLLGAPPLVIGGPGSDIVL